MIMGILNLFRKRIKDPELCRLRDLLAVVYASGEMTTKERTTILEIAAKHNISSSKFHQMLEIAPDSVQDIYPTSEEDRYQYLYELIYLMTVNRKHSTRAIDYIRFIAAKMGYSPKDVYEMTEIIDSSPFTPSTKQKITPTKWTIKFERDFNQEEVAAVEQAVVVSSEYGNSIQFTLRSGGMTYIPLDHNSDLSTGEIIDLSKAKLICLEKSGESDIYRVGYQESPW